jgi:chemotaxis protein methyltransferase CheR
MSGARGLVMTPQLFAILSGLVEDRAGLHYAHSEGELFTDKLTARALEAGFETLLDYYYFLRYDPGGSQELDALIDALLVHETYFFREFPPLQLVVDGFLAPLVAAGGRPRVWCAACATGEEPLTLAMLLAERGLLDRVELVASDVGARALARAESGDFSKRALRAPPPNFPWERRLRVEEGRVVVDRLIRAAVSWKRVNLFDGPAIAELGQFDVVLCRNVLIYFNDTNAQRVLKHLHDALVNGGVLLIGVSESLLRFATPYVCEEHAGVFLYRKVS